MAGPWTGLARRYVIPMQYPEREPRQRAYPDDWEKRRGRDGGRIKWKGVEINVTLALKGRELGLKPVDTGKWAVYFEHLELVIFDERQGCIRAAKRLKPVSTADPATP